MLTSTVQVQPKFVGRGAEYGVQMGTERSQRTEMGEPIKQTFYRKQAARQAGATRSRTEPDPAGDLSILLVLLLMLLCACYGAPQTASASRWLAGAVAGNPPRHAAASNGSM